MRRRVFCEGKDDVTALREILGRWFDGRMEEPIRMGSRSHPVSKHGAHTIELVASGDRKKVFDDVARIGDYDSSDLDGVGVCFDPDRDDWQVLVANRLDLIAPDGRHVRVVPLPWQSDLALVELELNEENLDRIASAICARTSASWHPMVSRWATEARTAGAKVTWKTLTRLWNAILRDDTIDDGFFAQVVGGQLPAAKPHVEALLKHTQLWRGLDELTKP